MNPSPIAALVLVAVIGLTTAACDVAEESAQKLTEKAEQAVQEITREAVSDTLSAFNEQIDQVQKSASELFGQSEDEAAKDKPEREVEKPSPSFKEGVET